MTPADGGATVVMTGGTSGFGALAAERMRSAGARLLLGGRAPRGADPPRGATPSGTIALDLASQGSVRTFAEQMRERLGNDSIDALVLNAGLVLPDATSRTEGIETTFAVNHLAHHLLLRLLEPSLAADAVVVLTTSGTHDPATRAGLVPPRHADAELLAHPEREPGADPRSRGAGQHAYTTSKLCAVLTARELAARHEGFRVIAFDPGQVFGTGLVRHLALPQRVAWRVLGGLPTLRRLSPTINSPTAAGTALADLALGREVPPDGGGYAALRHDRLTWREPSALARDAVVGRALWRDSEHLAPLGTAPQHPADVIRCEQPLAPNV